MIDRIRVLEALASVGRTKLKPDDGCVTISMSLDECTQKFHPSICSMYMYFAPVLKSSPSADGGRCGVVKFTACLVRKCHP